MRTPKHTTAGDWRPNAEGLIIARCLNIALREVVIRNIRTTTFFVKFRVNSEFPNFLYPFLYPNLYLFLYSFKNIQETPLDLPSTFFLSILTLVFRPSFLPSFHPSFLPSILMQAYIRVHPTQINSPFPMSSRPCAGTLCNYC